MPKTPRISGLLVLSLLAAATLPAQTEPTTTIPAGTSYTTDKSGIVNGVRIDVQPDGSLKNERQFAMVGSDGTAIDSQGRLYTTTRGAGVFALTTDSLTKSRSEWHARFVRESN